LPWKLNKDADNVGIEDAKCANHLMSAARYTLRGQSQDRFGPGALFGGSDGKLLGVIPLPDILKAASECVNVKYREGSCVPVDRFACVKTVSGFVNEVCYDAANTYMVILLKTTWYHYCGIPQDTVTAMENGDVGRYYNSQVKGRFGCQGQPVPNY
jgi:hypothetical protein